MKLLIATQQIGKRWSGLGTYATNLVNGLIDRGADVTVMCPANMAEGAGARTIPVALGGWAKAVNYWLPLASAFGRGMKALPPGTFDMIHFTDAREALFAPKNIPVVGTMNDYYAATSPVDPLYFMRHYSDWIVRYPYYQALKVFESSALAKLDGVIANSKFVANAISSRYRVDESKIEVISYGIEKSPTDEVEALEGEPSILFVGANFQRKGLPDLLRAASLAARKHPLLVVHVVGEDSKVNVARSLAKELGIENATRFHGLVANERVRRLKADMFVMPSIVEGFGIVFLEAMAKGVPVIGGRVGGTAELIEDGVNGFAVDPGDIEDLARRIDRLATDPAARSRFVEAGFATVEKYSIENMVDKTARFYEKILGGA